MREGKLQDYFKVSLLVLSVPLAAIQIFKFIYTPSDPLRCEATVSTVYWPNAHLEPVYFEQVDKTARQQAEYALEYSADLIDKELDQI